VLLALSVAAGPAWGQASAAEPAQAAPAAQASAPAAQAGAGGDAAYEAQFLAMAHQDGQKEIALANLASSKAQRAEVKALAEKIRTDHQNAGRELEKIATAKKMTLPAQAADHQSATAKFQKLSGNNFDREYVNLMVTEHQKAIEAFSQAAEKADGEVKSFAEKTLPALREHLQQAEALQSTLK
jgi:putative membrane protein